MRGLEAKIKHGLRTNGINCQSVYRIPHEGEPRVLISFDSKSTKRLTTRRIRKALNSLELGQFNVPSEFQRLSAAFLHLEVVLGARTETSPMGIAL
jgi:hypothetical protein